MGNYTLDNSMWERPESITGPRPVYYVTTRNGAPFHAASCASHSLPSRLCVRGLRGKPSQRPGWDPIHDSGTGSQHFYNHFKNQGCIPWLAK